MQKFQVVFYPDNGGIQYLEVFDNKADANSHADSLHYQMLMDMRQAETSYQMGFYSVITVQ